MNSQHEKTNSKVDLKISGIYMYKNKSESEIYITNYTI